MSFLVINSLFSDTTGTEGHYDNPIELQVGDPEYDYIDPRPVGDEFSQNVDRHRNLATYLDDPAYADVSNQTTGRGPDAYEDVIVGNKYDRRTTNHHQRPHLYYNTVMLNNKANTTTA